MSHCFQREQCVLQRFTTFLILLFTLIATSPSPAREWTAKTSHTIDGEFVQLDSGTVTIRLPDGNTARIPLDQLSDGDQKYVASKIPKSEKIGFNTPRDVLEREAQKDNPEALYYLGRCYEAGMNGCPRDKKKADEFYQKGSQAADGGNPYAQCCRAVCYDNGAGVRRNTAESFKWFRLAADQGNAVGQTGLGNCYADGTGVPRDKEEAVKWYRLAAAQGFAGGQFHLALSYTNGEGVRRDAAEAVKWFLQSAEQGYAPAQFLLNICYEGGEGVPRDEAEALKWHLKAAGQGFAPAQYTLGIRYENGVGVRKDKVEAVKWYRLSAEQEFPDAQHRLGVCYDNGFGVPEDKAEAVKWYRLAAAQDLANAQNALGLCYANGAGVPRNAEEAVKWYRLAAELRFPEAQYNLGVCYEHGRGVRQDAAEAVEWYRLAAEQEFPEAQCNLGACYFNGTGVPKDAAEAIKWFRLAAEQGFALAQRNLGVCYANGVGVRENKTEAVKWLRLAEEQGDGPAANLLRELESKGGNTPNPTPPEDDDDEDVIDPEKLEKFRKAAEQGDAESQNALGLFYLMGIGVEENDAEAVKWFRKAAEQGYADAQFFLGVCYLNGNGVAQDVQQAIPWFRKSAAQGKEEAIEILKKLGVDVSEPTPPTPPTPPQPPSQASNTYRNKEYDFSFTYSEDWTLRSDPAALGTLVALAGPSSNGDKPPFMGVMVQPPEQNLLRTTRAEYQRELQRTFSNAVIKEFGTRQLGGREALYCQFTSTMVDGRRWETLILLTPHKNKTFFMMFNCPPGTLDKFRPVFDAMVASFRFDGGVSPSPQPPTPNQPSPNPRPTPNPTPTPNPPTPQPPGENASSGMPQGNSGIVGVWLAMDVGLGRGMTWSHIVFYEDGTYRLLIPAKGLYGFDKEKDKKDNGGKNVWGTYTFNGRTGNWKGNATKTAGSEIKLESDGGLYLGGSYTRFYRCNSVDNFRFDGSYTSYSDPADPDLSKPGEKPIIHFKSDGTFVDEGLFAATYQVLGIGIGKTKKDWLYSCFGLILCALVKHRTMREIWWFA